MCLSFFWLKKAWRTDNVMKTRLRGEQGRSVLHLRLVSSADSSLQTIQSRQRKHVAFRHRKNLNGKL